MLNGAGDASRDVKLWRNDFTGLTDLIIVRHIARINRGPRRANCSAEFIGEREHHFFKLLSRPERATAGNNDLRCCQFRPVLTL